MITVTGRDMDHIVGLYMIQKRIDKYTGSYNEQARGTAQIMQDINIDMLWMITQG